MTFEFRILENEKSLPVGLITLVEEGENYVACRKKVILEYHA